MAETLCLSDSDRSSSSDQSVPSRSNNRSLRIAEKERKKNEAEDSFVLALRYFSEVEAGTPVTGNDELDRNLAVVEKVAFSKGLSPEAISVLLEFAMSLRMGSSPCVRVLKCLIPASVVPQQAVVRAVVWLNVSKIPISTQVLFIKWVLTVFDLIDAKDQLRAIYGFIFSFITEENLCPYICHLLYLLTRKENGKPSLMHRTWTHGRQPFLMHLLSLYKVFCPELVTLSIPSRIRSGFKNYISPWKSALVAVQKSNGQQVSSSISAAFTIKEKSISRKRKHCHLDLPALSSVLNKEPQSEQTSRRKMVPLVHLSSFAQMLKDMHRIEVIHICIKSSSGSENFCHKKNSFHNSKILSLRTSNLSHFVFQEGFSSSDAFLYKFLNVWDGSLLRPQILGLLSNIPVIPSTQIGRLLFEPLTQLFFTSSMFFKCGLMECLNNMLLKWLTWHSVYALEDDLDISLNSHTSINITLSGFKDSVMELVHFVGRLASLGLQLEGCNTLLLSFILDFYETVCDTFLKFGLPLVVMPPPGVFYPALLATDPVSVDRLAYIMHRYKLNLTSAKSQEKQTEQAFHISRHTFRQFNHYLVFMVNCLWNCRMFHANTDMHVREELLHKSNVPQYWTRFDFIHHPAFTGYAVDFHQKCWPGKKDVDVNSIKQSKPWSWYLEYLFNQGFDGLKDFVHSSISRQVTAGDKLQDSQQR
uniref:Centromere protein I n=1 Tax=Oryzias sinensis TaxID=183150 RepID=A0A8C7ZRN7_9TELE